MKILITGASGLVGSRFVELYTNPPDLLTPSHEELDLTNKSSVKKYFSSNRVDAIVNFAAYTNVSEGENQRGDKNGECWKVNVEGVESLLAASPGKFFIQISTDMVFPGSKEKPGPYIESDQPETDSDKVVWYGFTKGEAEKLVKGRGAILRIINPVRANFSRKLDYVRKHLKLYQERRLYPLFDDQQTSITFIDEACLALGKIVHAQKTGIFHSSSPDPATPYQVVKYAINKLYEPDFSPREGSIETMKSKVRYSKFGGLKVEDSEKRLGIKFSSWREIIDKLIDQGITV